jgi:hypothetical protein
MWEGAEPIRVEEFREGDTLVVKAEIPGLGGVKRQRSRDTSRSSVPQSAAHTRRRIETSRIAHCAAWPQIGTMSSRAGDERYHPA